MRDADGCIRRSGQFAQGFRRGEDSSVVVISAGGWAASRSKDKAGTRSGRCTAAGRGDGEGGNERGQGSKKKEFPKIKIMDRSTLAPHERELVVGKATRVPRTNSTALRKANGFKEWN